MSTGHEGQRFVVTGAASGIGLAVARIAIERGARVALLDRDQAALSTACQALGAAALPVLCDVADPAAVTAAVEQAARALGGIDAVVNSAGIDSRLPLEQLPDEEWSRVMA
ncbi:MAG: short-chain dehydrogenase, partial [Rhizobacter sp.]|nr:short-chain dehydrogenase [Rhizobacter sp.]